MFDGRPGFDPARRNAGLKLVLAHHNAYIALVEIWSPVWRSPSAHAVRVERVSEKNADAEKHKQGRDSLGHRLAPSRIMPGTAALRNLR
jgi:hypothetical protein